MIRSTFSNYKSNSLKRVILLFISTEGGKYSVYYLILYIFNYLLIIVA